MLLAIMGLSGCSCSCIRWSNGPNGPLPCYDCEENPCVCVVDNECEKCEENPCVCCTRCMKQPCVCTQRQFPSPIEEFTPEDFDEEFFENYTLILVQIFSIINPLYDYEFYTVFVENEELIFLIEFTTPHLIYSGTHRAFYFAIIVSNDILSNYTIGNGRVFITYDVLYFDTFPPPKNCRDWLIEVQKNSIKHTAGIISRNWQSLRERDGVIVLTNSSWIL